MHRITGLVSRFRRHEGGAFAVTFALMAIVIIAFGGAVVDYVSLEQTRNRAQVALDASALALQPKIYSLDEGELKVLAQALLTERVKSGGLSEGIVATIVDLTKDEGAGSLYMEATVSLPTIFVSLVGVTEMRARIASEATQASIDIEVAVALDLSGSMNNSIPNGTGGTTTKIASLKTALNQLIELIVQDDQSPTTSRMALVPYSQAVNVGTYASTVRGAITQPTAITNVTWSTGTAKTIGSITKANPMVITSNAHGFANGDTVYVTGTSGTMSQIDSRIYVVSNANTNTFRLTLNGTAVNSTGYTSYSGNLGRVTKCVVATCELVVTSAGHGLSLNANAYITGVVMANTTTENYSTTRANGTAINPTFESFYNDATESFNNNNGARRVDNVDYNWINNNPSDTDYKFLAWKVAGPVTANTFVLPGTAVNNGKVYGTYTSGGTVACVVQGCSQYLLTNPYSASPANGYNAVNLSRRRHAISTCVTERDINTFTDASYLATLLGRNYAASNNPCLADTILPLTITKGQNIATNVNKSTLHGVANTLVASGSTGGQIGVAWAWYLLSAGFNGPWPMASLPAPDDGVRPVAKAVVLMTDGEYNSVYKYGVIAKNSTSGSGDTNSMVGENAGNGSSYEQTAKLCQAMKDADIIVYTVGLAIDDKPVAKQMMATCASDPSKAYVAGTGQALQDVFVDIAGSLADLRLSQ